MITNRNRRRCGFTLLELLIAIAVLAVIASLVIPSAIASFRSQKLSYAAVEFAGQMNRLRIEALRTGQPQTLTFVPYSVRYITESIPPEAGNRRELQLSGNAKFQLARDPGRSVDRIVFHANGTATPNMFSIVGMKDQRVDIQVDRLTGGVHVSRAYKK